MLLGKITVPYKLTSEGFTSFEQTRKHLGKHCISSVPFFVTFCVNIYQMLRHTVKDLKICTACTCQVTLKMEGKQSCPLTQNEEKINLSYWISILIKILSKLFLHIMNSAKFYHLGILCYLLPLIFYCLLH